MDRSPKQENAERTILALTHGIQARREALQRHWTGSMRREDIVLFKAYGMKPEAGLNGLFNQLSNRFNEWRCQAKDLADYAATGTTSAIEVQKPVMDAALDASLSSSLPAAQRLARIKATHPKPS